MRFYKRLLIISFILLSSFVKAEKINLTEEEKQWLAKHQTIRVAPDPDFPPIEFFDNNKKYSGIAADYMKIIERKLGIKFQIIRCKNWDEVLEKAKNKEIDLIPAASKSPRRSKIMNVSSPYLKFQGILLTRKDSSHINSLEQLSGKKLAVVSGYVWEEFLLLNNPEIIIKPVDNILDAIVDVSMGSVDALIATMPIALYYIEKQGILNLRFAGQTNYYTNLCVQTRKDWPILNTLIEKSLQSIPDIEKKQILRKWIPLKQKNFFQDKFFWIIIGSSLLIIFVVFLLIFLFNRLLRKQINIKTRELKDTSILLETTLNAIPDIIGIQDDKHRIVRYNDAGYKFLDKKIEDVKGKKCYELINRCEECDSCALSKVYVSKKSEHIIRYEKHKHIWLDVRAYPIFNKNGNIVKVVEHVRDITEQKLTEKALKESEKQYRELLENAPIGIIIHLKDNLKYINKRAREIMEVDFPTDNKTINSRKFKNHFKSISTFDFVHDDSKELIKKRIDNILKTGKTQDLAEGKFITLKKNIIDVETVSMPVSYNKEKCILVLFKNISKRKKYEKEIIEKNKYLQIINNLSDKLRLSYNIQSVAKESVSAMMEFSNSPSVGIFLLNNETSSLDSIFMKGFGEETQRIAKRLPLEGSLTAITIKEKRIVTSKEIAEDNRLEAEVKKNFLSDNLASVVSIPLLYKDEILGAINLIFKEMPVLKLSDYKTLSGIASAIAMALKNAIYISKIKEEMEMRKKAESKIKEDAEKLEEIVKDRTSELEEKNNKLKHFNDLFVNREFRIKELRDEVDELKKKNKE